MSTFKAAGPHDDLIAALVREAGGEPNKIAVIKALRERTGLGLAEAKLVVESYGERCGVETLRPRPVDLRVGALAGVLVLLAIVAGAVAYSLAR